MILTGFLRMVPSWAYGGLAIVALCIGIELHGQHRGAARIQSLWDRDVAAAEAQAETLRILRQSHIDKRETKSVAVAVKRQTVVQSNLAKVDTYAPSSAPPLPGTWRLWHDAAATGETVSDPGSANAASVSLKQTAVTVARNYAACLDDQSRLTDLQDIIRTLTGESNAKAAE